MCRMWGDLSRLAVSDCPRHQNLALLDVWYYMELWFFLGYFLIFLLEESRKENKELVLVIVKQTRVCEGFVFFSGLLLPGEGFTCIMSFVIINI